MKLCTCKGIRTCSSCNPNKIKIENQNCIVCYFCPKISKIVKENCISDLKCEEFHKVNIELNGIILIENFLTEDDKNYLLGGICSNSWVDSQSGRRKQDFGPKVNFKKRKINLTKFQGLPEYIERFVNRFSDIPELKDFNPVELCNLEYNPTRGASIDPHFDDFWLWGERLVTINVQSSTYLTFTPGFPDMFDESSQAFFSSVCSENHENMGNNCAVSIKVPLPEGSLVIVSGDARHKWMHAVSAADVQSTRIASTLRELSMEFTENDRELSRKLIDLSLTFNGQPVN
uniref:Alpha ketoglutarate dependent dioxygenase ABH4 n=1 Tax=Schmidtea mediterranea TaxID=79327 RepID=I1ZIC5_SCHMD|nr:alpha ketoglutarate dependent dioxygenase ABH4 [Schmidtea mediterranea]